MRNAIVIALSLTALAACSTEIPDSGAGVGTGTLPPAAAVTAAPLDGEGAAIAAQTTAALGVAPTTTQPPLSAMGAGAATSGIDATPASAARDRKSVV